MMSLSQKLINNFYMRIKLLITLLLLYSVACKTEKEGKSDLDQGTETQVTFDKTKWSVKEGMNYPYRDQMLNDVVYNDTIRSLDKNEILELLGEPDRVNDGHLYYMITQRRLGVWPLKTKTMVIKLSEDTIVWIKIHG